MVDHAALWFAAVTIVALVISALWAEMRFRGYAKLPAHFNAVGKPTRFASRHLVIWLTPAIFGSLLALLLVLIETLPPKLINGDPKNAVFISCALVLGAQALILWLLLRWSRGEG